MIRRHVEPWLGHQTWMIRFGRVTVAWEHRQRRAFQYPPQSLRRLAMQTVENRRNRRLVHSAGHKPYVPTRL